jgi:hypothetical protein
MFCNDAGLEGYNEAKYIRQNGSRLSFHILTGTNRPLKGDD